MVVCPGETVGAHNGPKKRRKGGRTDADADADADADGRMV